MTKGLFLKNVLLICLFISNLFSSNTYTLNTFDFSPYVNEKEGLVIDIVKELFKKSNIQYTIKTLPQSRAIRNTRNNLYDIVTPIQRSQTREAKFKWVGPILITQTALYTLPNSNLNIDVFNDIFKQEILVIRGSVEEEYLSSFGIKTQAVRSDLQNAYKLKANRAKVWATDTISASYYSKKSNVNIKKHLILLTTLRSLAFNLNTNDKTIALLNNNLQKMYNDGTIKKILLSYSKKYDIQDVLKFLE